MSAQVYEKCSVSDPCARHRCAAALPQEFITKGEKVGGIFRCQQGGENCFTEGVKSVLNIQKKKRKKIIMVLFFSPAMKDLVSGETQGTSDKEQSKRS